MSKLVVLFLIAVFSLESYSSNISIDNSNSAKNEAIFIPNKGQASNADGTANSEILFSANKGGIQLFVLKDRIAIQKVEWNLDSATKFDAYSNLMDDTISKKYKSFRTDIIWLEKSSNMKIEGVGESSYYFNYYTQNTPPEGITNLTGYTKLKFTNIYTGIDLWLSFSPKSNAFKYEWHVAPGADYRLIKWYYSHSDSIAIGHLGQILIHTPLGTLSEPAPKSYQEENEIVSSFVRRADTFSFEIPFLDSKRILVIDPDLIWGSYLGGNGIENNHRFVKINNHIYTLLTTQSIGLALNGFQSNNSGQSDILVSKIQINSNKVWTTYFGGEKRELSAFIRLDKNLDIYINGITNSINSIGYNGYQNVKSNQGDDFDNFILKLDTNGKKIWSSYYGGDGEEAGANLIFNTEKDFFYLISSTNSLNNISSSNVHKSSLNIQQGNLNTDIFIAKFSLNGSRIWGTYYGGDGSEIISASYIDSNNNILLVGNSSYSQVVYGIAYLPSYPNAFNISNLKNSFFSKFSENGQLLMGTFLPFGDFFTPYVIHKKNNLLYQVGVSNSNSIPNFSKFQSTNMSLNSWSNNVNSIIFCTDTNYNLVWGSYYGGNNKEYLNSICFVNDTLNLHGWSNSTDIENRLKFINKKIGENDLIQVKIDNQGNLISSKYFGGPSNEILSDVLIDKSYLYLSGRTSSTTGISKNGFQNVYGGSDDGFIMKFCLSATSDTTIDTICFGDSLLFQGVMHRNSGTYSYNYTNIDGCDSNFVLVLNTVNNFVNDHRYTICKGQNVQIGTQIFTQSDSIVFHYQSSNGCDSTEIHVIKVNDTLYSPIDTFQVCKGTSVLGELNEGRFKRNLSSSNGCDSVYLFEVLHFPSLHSSSTHNICYGDSFRYHSSSGIYIDHFTNQYGCDSIDTLSLTIYPPVPITTIDTQVCYGDSILFYGQKLTQSGTYSHTLFNRNNCDSIIRLKATFHSVVPALSIADTIACNGDSIWLQIPTIYAKYLWNTGITSSKIRLDKAGIYFCTVWDQKQCSTTDSFTLSYSIIPNISIKSPTEIGIGIATPIEALGGLPVHSSWYWRSTANLSCQYCFSPTIFADTNCWVWTTYTDDFGCKATDSAWIRAVRFTDNFGFPSSFSPNNDFINELFVPEGRDIEQFDLQIFNRWGEKIYDNGGNSNGWNGKYQDKHVSAGLYPYTYKLKMKTGKEFSGKGTVYLMK